MKHLILWYSFTILYQRGRLIILAALHQRHKVKIGARLMFKLLFPLTLMIMIITIIIIIKVLLFSIYLPILQVYINLRYSSILLLLLMMMIIKFISIMMLLLLLLEYK